MPRSSNSNPPPRRSERATLRSSLRSSLHSEGLLARQVRDGSKIAACDELARIAHAALHAARAASERCVGARVLHGRDAIEALEMASKVALIREAAAHRDVRRRSTVDQQTARVPDA